MKPVKYFKNPRYEIYPDGKVLDTEIGREIKPGRKADDGANRLELRTPNGRVIYPRHKRVIAEAFLNGNKKLNSGVFVYPTDGDEENIHAGNITVSNKRPGVTKPVKRNRPHDPMTRDSEICDWWGCGSIFHRYEGLYGHPRIKIKRAPHFGRESAAFKAGLTP